MTVSLGFTSAGRSRRTGACGRCRGPRSRARRRRARSRAPRGVDDLAPQRIAFVESTSASSACTPATASSRSLAPRSTCISNPWTSSFRKSRAPPDQLVPERVEPGGGDGLGADVGGLGGAREMALAHLEQRAAPGVGRNVDLRVAVLVPERDPAGLPARSAAARALERGVRVGQRLERHDPAAVACVAQALGVLARVRADVEHQVDALAREQLGRAAGPRRPATGPAS